MWERGNKIYSRFGEQNEYERVNDDGEEEPSCIGRRRYTYENE